MANDYSNVTSVLAFTRHFLDGQTNFNSTTRPKLTEVQAFLERTSGLMNVALRSMGLTTPVNQTSAKAAIDDWVTLKVAEYVEMTQRGTGYSDGEGSRLAAFRGALKEAKLFVADNRQGFIDLGVAVSRTMASGLSFTALDAQSERLDPDDSTLAQPMFIRGKFDNPDEVTE